MKMKKLFPSALSVMICLMLAACGAKTESANPNNTGQSANNQPQGSASGSGSATKPETQSVYFTSEYTDLKKDCKDAFKSVGEGQDMPLHCKGVGGYRIYIYNSAMASHISAEKEGGQDPIMLATQSLNYSDKGKVEWRISEGKPFAIIMRITKYDPPADAENLFDEKYKTGEALIVKGLKGYEQIDFEVDAKEANANQKARDLADKNFKKK
jgi:hypothetical protein